MKAMVEYITKERARDLVVTAAQGNISRLACMLGKLEDEPPADVVEVVHARWEETDWETWSCTHCGIEWQFLDGMTPEENDAFYCPQCGARMDGGESE